MIFGKFAIYSYLFAIGLLATGVMLNNAIGAQIFAEGTVTEESLTTLIGEQDTAVGDIEPNPLFPFGDFIAGIRAVAGIIIGTVTGGVVLDTLKAIPFYTADASIDIMFRLFFSFSSAALIINLLSGRDL